MLTTNCPVCPAKAGQGCINLVTGEKLKQATPCHQSRIDHYVANPITITGDNHVMGAWEDAPGHDHPLRNWNVDCFSSQRDGSLFCSLIRNRKNEPLPMINLGNGYWRPRSPTEIQWTLCS